MHNDARIVAPSVTVSDHALSPRPTRTEPPGTPPAHQGITRDRPVTRTGTVGRDVDDEALDRLASRLRQRRETRYERLAKPLLDRVVALVLLVVLSPLLLVVASVVLVAMGRPVFFGQVRGGRSGRAFPMLKFRTMRPDRRCPEPVAYAGPERRLTHKSAEDPRHTRIGRLMRKFSLDELPQLVNVLTGSMSLVGPRPELYGMTADYAPWQRARHLVKPGVTGLWQTTERGKGLLLHECIDLDLRYIERLSLREDLRILVRTPIALLRNRGVV